MPLTGGITETACQGVLVDPGGNDGDYPNSVSSQFTIDPPGASSVSIHFDMLNLGQFPDGDAVYILDGPSLTSPPLVQATTWNQVQGETYTSTNPDGVITVAFLSNNFGSPAPGFQLVWECTQINTPPTPNFTYELGEECLGEVAFEDVSTGFADYLELGLWRWHHLKRAEP